MDVNTGEILAMASLGDFDLNDYQAVSDETMLEILAEPDIERRAELLSAAQQLQWRNKALSDTYEPGSQLREQEVYFHHKGCEQSHLFDAFSN